MQKKQVAFSHTHTPASHYNTGSWAAAVSAAVRLRRDPFGRNTGTGETPVPGTGTWRWAKEMGQSE
jgi:hypothetical protein